MAKRTRSTITPDDLKALLDYDPETGHFTWKWRGSEWFPTGRNWEQWNSKHAGKPAFTTVNRDGYLHGGIFGITIKAHRAALAMVLGVWPTDEVDHINGVKSDNRLSNLREVSKTENQRNARISKANKSGRTGVCWYQTYNKWTAHIRVNKKTVTLGYFVAFEDAVSAREMAEEKYGFFKNHLRNAARAYRGEKG